MINDPDFLLTGKKMSARLITQFDKEHIREELISLYHSLVMN